MDKKTWDAVVIGGGAAGLSAGIVLARAQAEVVVVDAGRPRNAPAQQMHGVASRDGMNPLEFLAKAREELFRFGGVVQPTTVTNIDGPEGGPFGVALDLGAQLSTRAVLVATGTDDELPHVPGLRERWARDVHHCPYCHGYEVRDQKLAVIGGPVAELSTHQAALLRRYSSDVTLLGNELHIPARDRDRLAAFGVRIIDGRVTGLDITGDRITGVELDGDRTVPCQSVFVAPRPRPHDGLLNALGCRRDPASGLVETDAMGQTSRPGVWAAGNVVNPRALVATVSGAGCTAAVAMTNWLLAQDLATATRKSGPDDGEAR